MQTVVNRGMAGRKTTVRLAKNGIKTATQKSSQGVGGTRVWRATLLATALLGAYGTTAIASPVTTLTCTATGCSPADPVPGASYSESLTGNNYNQWVVTGNGADFELDGGTVTAEGSKLRGVGATGGNAHILLNGVTIQTNATANELTGWGGSWRDGFRGRQRCHGEQ